MAEDGEITVVVEGEDDAAGASSATSQIEALNRQADADRAKAARLNLQTAHLRREADLRSVDTAMLTAENEARAAEAALKDADDMGDSDAKVAATRRLTAAEVRRNNLEMAQQQLHRTPISSGDQFEDHVSRFTDKTAQWMREHKDWVTDPRKNAKVTGAHNFAVSEGLTPDTDEYFEFVEKMVGLRGGNGGSRSSTNMRREGPKYDPADHRTHVTPDGVYLTENERKLATDGTLVFNAGPRRGQPIGIQEMARRKAEMAKQGMYNRI
jgi:hypothetical protein